jgi:hypothetical protein
LSRAQGAARPSAQPRNTSIFAQYVRQTAVW